MPEKEAGHKMECDQAIIDLANDLEGEIIKRLADYLQQEDVRFEGLFHADVSGKEVQKTCTFKILLGEEAEMLKASGDQDTTDKLDLHISLEPNWSLNHKAEEYTSEEMQKLLMQALPSAQVGFGELGLTILLEINGEHFRMRFPGGGLFLEELLSDLLEDLKSVMQFARDDRAVRETEKQLTAKREQREKTRAELLARLGQTE